MSETTTVYGLWNEAAGAWIMDDDGRPFRTVNIDAARRTLDELEANGAGGVQLVTFVDEHYPGEFSRMAESEARTAATLEQHFRSRRTPDQEPSR